MSAILRLNADERALPLPKVATLPDRRPLRWLVE